VGVRFDLIIVHSWLFYFVPLPIKGRGVEGRGTQWHYRPIKKHIKLNGSYSWVFRTLFIIRKTRINLKYGKSYNFYLRYKIILYDKGYDQL